MANNSGNNNINQNANAEQNVSQFAGDYSSNSSNSSNSNNINIWVSFLAVGVLALGGLAWALNIGSLQNSGNPNQSQPSVTSTPSSSH